MRIGCSRSLRGGCVAVLALLWLAAGARAQTRAVFQDPALVPGSVPARDPRGTAAPAADAEGIPSALASADSLYEAGAWDSAITEYKRYLFFHDPGPVWDSCAERIGRAYWNLGAKEEALRALQRAAESASSDSARAARRLDIARVYAGSGEGSTAELELARLRLYSPFPAIRRAAAPHLALIELRDHRWEEARSSLADAPDLLASPDGQALDSLLQEASRTRVHAPARARRLSSILPGLGQISVGATPQGIHSFVLNGLLAWWLTASVLDGQPGNVLVATSFLRRYHRGGQYHAVRLAEERNERILRPLVQRMEERLRSMGIEERP
jgi:tetratricopeptide (TPR) repeat protein